MLVGNLVIASIPKNHQRKYIGTTTSLTLPFKCMNTNKKFGTKLYHINNLLKHSFCVYVARSSPA